METRHLPYILDYILQSKSDGQAHGGEGTVAGPVPRGRRTGLVLAAPLSI